ncbi:hypothetical protein, partial [Curtobacterium sp. ISL-83]|uniref:hypothetical protein n=1 Tax=Curtobacterium sp. ISL-83 TaxID=2819145 RepID=UPI001BEB24FF
PIRRHALGDWMWHDAPALLSPGRGRACYLLARPPLGDEPPDAVYLTASPRVVSDYRVSDGRLRSFEQAVEIFGDRWAGSPETDVRGTTTTSSLLRRASMTVQRSVAVTVAPTSRHVMDAIERLGSVKQFTQHIALLMPAEQLLLPHADQLEESIVERGCIQLTDYLDDWEAVSETELLENEEAPSRRAWLVEVLARGLEAGTARRLAPFRKRQTKAERRDFVEWLASAVPGAVKPSELEEVQRTRNVAPRNARSRSGWRPRDR